ncbi:MAG: bacillithiol biosynthesis deacetylase BshB1 [Planctomycetota bacterium]
MPDLTVNILAFGAHPDDVEIMAGGTLVMMKKKGYRTGIVDLTRGESGTYGTVAERAAEAAEAARILGLETRVNLGLPDADLHNTAESRLKVIEIIRRLRPEVVLAPVTHTRHPDHGAAGAIVREAAFLAGLAKIETDRPKHRPAAVLHYGELTKDTPDFVVDISDAWETKVAAIRAHKSQVYIPDRDGGAAPEARTLIRSKDFWEIVQARFRYFGGMNGVTYAEIFYCDTIPRVEDIVSAFTRKIK